MEKYLKAKYQKWFMQNDMFVWGFSAVELASSFHVHFSPLTSVFIRSWNGIVIYICWLLETTGREEKWESMEVKLNFHALIIVKIVSWWIFECLFVTKFSFSVKLVLDDAKTRFAWRLSRAIKPTELWRFIVRNFSDESRLRNFI